MLGFIPRKYTKLINTNDQLTDVKMSLQRVYELRCNQKLTQTKTSLPQIKNTRAAQMYLVDHEVCVCVCVWISARNATQGSKPVTAARQYEPRYWENSRV